ncbi:MAG: diacylglycerol kinase family protein [Thermodesulfovibrionales bacterium]
MVKEIVVIGNPVAGGGAARKKIQEAVRILQAQGGNVRLLLTKRREDAVSFARTVAEEEGRARLLSSVRQTAEDRPLPLVIAAGGDGTYNEVANGLALTPVPMAILPLGTTSVLARELGVPFDLGRALECALNGEIATVHLGRVSFGSPALPPENRSGRGEETPHASLRRTRYFLLMAGAGFDGEVIFGVDEGLKKHLRKGAYLLSGLRTLSRYAPRPLMVRARPLPPPSASGALPLPGARQERAISAYAVIVGKSARYGGDFTVTPDVSLSAPWLSIFATHGRRRRDLFRYVLRVVLGRGAHPGLRDVSRFRTEEISISGEAHVQIDGDYGGTTPVTIGIEKAALKLMVPKQ